MILDNIVAHTRVRVEASKLVVAPEHMKSRAQAVQTPHPFAFEQALQGEQLSFICEVKKASPSKGVIADHFPYLDIAKSYEDAGAAAISVLTEPDFFLGDNRYLSEIRERVSIPLLRKDFIVDPYQIYESKILGADAILLICAVLDTETLRELTALAHSLGMSVLVETHTEDEIQSAVDAGATLIGINNRNLDTFEVNLDTTVNLRALIPHGVTVISESGIKNRDDIERLAASGVNGFLIGETLMRSSNIKFELDALQERGGNDYVQG